MQHGLCAYTRLCFLLVLLLEATLATTNANEAPAVSRGDEEEVNLEWEVFGPSNNRHYGINILDANGEVIISDPTDRVLRAVVHPEDAPASLALHKVKAMYQRLPSEDGMHEDDVQAHDSLRDSLGENKAGEEQNDERDGSVLSSFLNWVWG